MAALERNAAVEVVGETWKSLSSHERFALTAGSLITCGLTIWLAHTFAVPQQIGRAGGLLQQPAWPVAIGVACIAAIACAAAAAIIASRIHYEGGLFCAAIALAALSARLGPLRFALFNSQVGPKVYLLLALELLLLYAALGIAWLILRFWTHLGWLPDERMPGELDEHEPFDQKLLAIAAQVIVMIFLMLLLAQSDAKAQVLAAVLISSYVASLAAHHFVAARPSVWFWMGPLVVGLIGYLLQFISPTDWMIGDARGFFAALSRPMPLDYASLGTAGALIGYWTSRRWQQHGHGTAEVPE